jgi:hypothetical protein
MAGNNVFLAKGTILTTLKEGTKCVEKTPNRTSTSGLMSRDFDLFGMTDLDGVHYIQMRIKSRMPGGTPDIYSFYPKKYVPMMFVGGADFSMTEDNCLVFQKLTMEIPSGKTFYNLAREIFGVKEKTYTANKAKYLLSKIPLVSTEQSGKNYITLEFPNPGYACDVLKSYSGIEDGYRKQLAEIVEVIADAQGAATFSGLKGKLETLDAKRFPKLTAMSGNVVKVPAMYASLAKTINAMLDNATDDTMVKRINSLLNKFNETLTRNNNSLDPKLERALNQLILFKKGVQAFERKALVSRLGSGTIYDFNMCLQNFFGLYLDQINSSGNKKGQWGGKKVKYSNLPTTNGNYDNTVLSKSNWKQMKSWQNPQPALEPASGNGSASAPGNGSASAPAASSSSSSAPAASSSSSSTPTTASSSTPTTATYAGTGTTGGSKKRRAPKRK